MDCAMVKAEAALAEEWLAKHIADLGEQQARVADSNVLVRARQRAQVIV